MSICIIPARKGSRRIKNKNIKKINNTFLISLVIKLAIKSKLFTKVIVSTDCKKIAKIAKNNGAEVPFLRDKKLSDNYTPTYAVLVNVVKKLKIKDQYIFCIYPTSIMTKIIDLKSAFKLFKKRKADFLCPVKKTNNSFLRSFINKGNYINYLLPKYKLFRTQDLPNIYLDSGSFYIYTRKGILSLNKKRPIPVKSIYYLLKNQFIDINYPEDLKIVKKIFNKKSIH